jgi:hypothetical protein
MNIVNSEIKVNDIAPLVTGSIWTCPSNHFYVLGFQNYRNGFMFCCITCGIVCFPGIKTESEIREFIYLQSFKRLTNSAIIDIKSR